MNDRQLTKNQAIKEAKRLKRQGATLLDISKYLASQGVLGERSKKPLSDATLSCWINRKTAKHDDKLATKRPAKENKVNSKLVAAMAVIEMNVPDSAKEQILKAIFK
jgi:hypothetical protein